MPARTYVALNRKGGVGKTSTCFHVGGELARRGQRVLLIDLDPQRNLTDKLLMDPATGEVAEVPYERTVAALFDPEVYVEDRAALVQSNPARPDRGPARRPPDGTPEHGQPERG